MTELLKKAFHEASKLPREQQDAIASLLLEELKSDRNWDRAFETSQDSLAKLADDALAEDQRGDRREESGRQENPPGSGAEDSRQAPCFPGRVPGASVRFGDDHIKVRRHIASQAPPGVPSAPSSMESSRRREAFRDRYVGIAEARAARQGAGPSGRALAALEGGALARRKARRRSSPAISS